MIPIRCLTLAALLSVAPATHAEPEIQVGFSPEGSARQLVLETIGGAKERIQILAYAFQAPDIMQAAPSAETLNSENVVVIRNAPEVVRQYLAHWQSRWDLGKPYDAKSFPGKSPSVPVP